MFCLDMLKAASADGSKSLTRFHRYRLVEEDFRPLLVEREKVAAEKASRRFLAIQNAPRCPLHSSQELQGPFCS